MNIEIKNLNRFTKMALASDSNVGTDVMKLLADENDEKIRAAVAATTDDIELLEKLSEDEERIVKIAVLKNSNCIDDIFEKLCDDDDKFVKAAVALGTNNVKLLKKLSKEELMIKFLVLSNPNCTDEIRNFINNDDEVKKTLKENSADEINKKVQKKELTIQELEIYKLARLYDKSCDENLKKEILKEYNSRLSKLPAKFLEKYDINSYKKEKLENSVAKLYKDCLIEKRNGMNFDSFFF